MQLSKQYGVRLFQVGCDQANVGKERDEANHLHQKVKLAIGATLTGLIGILSVTTSVILMKGYGNLEQRAIKLNLDRAQEAYNQRVKELTTLNMSWSFGDDAYQFAKHPNQTFIDSNLTENISLKPAINVILYLDTQGQVIYGRGYAQDADALLPVSESIPAFLQANPHFLHHSNGTHSAVNDASVQTQLPSCQQGVMLLPESPLLYVACPVLTSQCEGPSAGTLLMGRYLDADFIQQISQTTRLDLNFHTLANLNSLSPHLRSIHAQLHQGAAWVNQAVNDQSIKGYKFIQNPSGKPVLLLEVALPREIYQQGQKSLQYLMLSLVIVGLLCGTTTYILAERLLRFWQQQREHEARYKIVIDQASEGIILVDHDTKTLLEINAAFHQLLGYSAAEMATLSLYDIDVAEPEAVNQSIQTVASGYPDLLVERQYRHCKGHLVDVEVSANRIRYGNRAVYCLVTRDITERKRAEAALRESEQRLAWQASHDPLTGLVNRRQFELYLEQALKSAQTSDLQHSLCYLDLDQFKIVNDTCGHHAGDELLRQVTFLLQAQIRSTDVLSRLGGDEFGLLLQHCSPQQATYIADVLRQHIQDFRFVWQDKVFSIGVSIGLVGINADQDLTQALSAADAACYQAKNAGRNRVHVCHPNSVNPIQHRDIQWTSQITNALQEHRLCLYAQSIIPISSAESGSAISYSNQPYEVLIRLRDEAGQLVLPNAFIPAAERHNLLTLIDRWVISTLFATQGQRYQKVWQQCHAQKITPWYSINLSSSSIQDSQFAAFLHEQFTCHQVPPQIICFEINETVAITHLRQTAELIREFKPLGCRFALDDFGSGISSFAYLKQLPVDFLKIDGTFIKDILHDPTDLALVEAINQVGHVMGMQTIAKYVQDTAILQKLRTIGVDYAQGFGISAPAPLLLPVSDPTLVQGSLGKDELSLV